MDDLEKKVPQGGVGDPKAAPAPAPKKADPVDEALRAAVPSKALDRLKEALPDALEEVSYHCGVPIVRVGKDGLLRVARFLKEDPGCRMLHLSNLCGVDMVRLRPTPRFDVVYHLFSPDLKERLTVKVAVEEDGEVPTVTTVWRGANWHEREAYDMFGIRFAGHPDPRRILMPEDFDAYPLRKDFPLEGREKDHGYWRQPEDENKYTYRD